MVLLQLQLLPNFVITQLAVIAQDQRHAIVFRQACDGGLQLRLLLPADDRPQRRRLRTGGFGDCGPVFNFHNYLLSTPTAPQNVNALVASHPQQPSGERRRTVVAGDGTLQLEEDFAGGIFRALPRVQHVTAKTEYARHIAAMDLPKGLGIVALGALDYA